MGADLEVSHEPSKTPPTTAAARSPTRLSFADGCYRTDGVDVGWLARLLPSLVFHSRYVGIVLRSGRKAARGEYDGTAWSESSVEVLRALESVGVEFEVSGVEHLAKLDGPCLVIGNHNSTLETMVLPGVIQPLRKVTFVIKESLLRYPVFKHIMASRDPIAVSQTNPRRDLKTMLTGGVERLENGTSLVIFPQGVRADDFEPARFNTIGIKLAQRTGVPIIPLALETRAWGPGRLLSDFGRIDPSRKVRFAFGPPLSVSGRGKEEHEAILQFIGDRVRTWAQEDRAMRGG